MRYLVVIAAFLASSFLACGGDDGGASPTATITHDAASSSTQSVEASPTEAASSTLAPTTHAPSPSPLPEPYQLTSEVIGLNAAATAVEPASANAPTFLTSEDVAASEVAWMSTSSMPGGGGVSIFTGNLLWHGQDAVFAQVQNLTNGDTVTVEGNGGRTLSYRVQANLVVPTGSAELDQALAPGDGDWLVLVTGAGPFNVSGDWDERR